MVLSFLELKTLFPHPSLKTQINTKKIKISKTVQQQGTINNLKYSNHYPNILSSCDEKGYISLINTNIENNKKIENNNFNNTNLSKEIKPIFIEKIHDNAVFGLDWSENDSKLLTSSADQKGKMINFSRDKYGKVELELIGHSKRIKCISQNVFNDNIICTCGGDSIIFIWDKRNPNKKYCNKHCPYFRNNSYDKISHIHPVGAFRNVYKDLMLKKKFFPSDGNFLNTEMPNTFTGSDFFSEDLVVSIETNNDEIKFWDMRNMLNTELDYIFSETKITKRHLGKFEQKNYLAAISPYTYIYSNYAMIKERNKMSSKYLSNNNMLFGLNYYMNFSNSNSNKQSKNFTIDKYIKKIKYFNNFDYEKTKNIEKELLINQIINNSSSDAYIPREYEEEVFYKNKINEIKNKRTKKGITSLNINRNERKIVINSISNTQYIYDSLYMDIKKPIELKGHESSYYVKSVLSPCGRFVLSGSNQSCVHIWDLKNKDNSIELKGYHTTPVNAVDWNRNSINNIASGCDSGSIIIWSLQEEM